MKEKDSILQLWSVSLLQRKLEAHESVNSELLDLFQQYRNANPAGSDHSYVSPDSFSNDIQNPALEVLKKFIMDNIYDVALGKNEKYWRQFKLQNIDIDLTGLWFQISNNHSFHETHVHEYAHTCYPEDGMLVIFPSYLKHMAFPYKGEKNRVVVSFHAQVNSATPIEYHYAFN